MKGFILLSLLIAATSALNTGRIVGGDIAVKGQFPYHCMLTRGKSFTCGCVIINNRTALTSAACIQPGARYEIVAGTVNNNGADGTEYIVSEAIPHEDYGDFVNDIALLRTEEEIVYSENVHSVPLAKTRPSNSSQCVFTGWGYTTNQGPVSQILRYIRTSLISDKDCAIRTTIDHPGTCCFYSGLGRGACNGDNGGPIVCDGVLFGIGSFAYGGCAAGNPDGASNMLYFTEWANKQMQKFGDQLI